MATFERLPPGNIVCTAQLAQSIAMVLLYVSPLTCIVYMAFVARFQPTMAYSPPEAMKVSEIQPSHVEW
jgi:hypothetical protein